VNLERQVRRHRTADSPRLFFVRHGPLVTIRVAEKNASRTVFTPRKDPLRPPPVLATDGSREASGASPRKRLSGQLYSRPLKSDFLSPRKLVSPDLWSMPHAEPGGIRSPSSPPSLRRLLPAYCPLVLSTIMRTRRQVQRVRDKKSPAIAAPPISSVPPPGPEHHYVCSETGTASTR